MNFLHLYDQKGYSAGMIKACVDNVLTEVYMKLKKKEEPLNETMFIQELKEKQVVLEEEDYHKFTESFHSMKKGAKSKQKSSKKKK